MATILRQATKADLPGMAAVYVSAFPESIRHFFDTPPVEAIADALEVAREAEPGSVLVAESEGRIVGYCLAPAHLSKIARTARHYLWRFVRRWLAGRYGLGLRPLWLLGLDKLHARRERRDDPYHAEAHILSIALDPDFQGQGLGKALLERGLAYLEKAGADTVRLEVRPGNGAALHLYEKYGFRTVGRTSDSQGDWLIMLRSGGPSGNAPAT